MRPKNRIYVLYILPYLMNILTRTTDTALIKIGRKCLTQDSNLPQNDVAPILLISTSYVPKINPRPPITV